MCEVWGMRCEAWGVRCEVWGVRCETLRSAKYHSDVWVHRCEVWGVRHCRVWSDIVTCGSIGVTQFLTKNTFILVSSIANTFILVSSIANTHSIPCEHWKILIDVSRHHSYLKSLLHPLICSQRKLHNSCAVPSLWLLFLANHCNQPTVKISLPCPHCS